MKNNNFTYFVMGAIDHTGRGYYWTKKLNWCGNLLTDIVSENPHCNFLMWKPTEAEAEEHCSFLNKRLKKKGLFGEPQGDLCAWSKVDYGVPAAYQRPPIDSVA